MFKGWLVLEIFGESWGDLKKGIKGIEILQFIVFLYI